MSNDRHSNEHHDGGDEYGGGWQPIPQSEGYDGEATAFVQLPPDFMLDGVPLEAPGHGYVPPMITPLVPLNPDPGATGQWNFTTDAPEAPSEPERDPQATGQWSFPEAAEAESASTGQWRIPVVSDSSDESGEYTASMLAQYASSAPATLPGGAPAPWAVPDADAAEPENAPGHAPDPAPEHVEEHTTDPAERPDSPEGLTAEPAAEFAPEPAAEPSYTEEPAFPDDVTAALPTTSSADSDEHPHTSYTLRVNGADRPVTDSWIGESLLYVLRERLGLAGAKDGCSQGECGACNVQVDGRLVASCLVPAATAAGSEVRTVEGLATDGEPSDVQRALARCGAVQCGFCIPGMAMTVHDLLEGNHAPTELEARQALCGNLCRCSGYRGVLDAVQEVVAERGAAAAAESTDEARIPHQIPHPHDGGMA
ncbi:2Fe-2S iron-sulfur cluster-binding protein [Streptomyces sp. NPDC006460]|uniref:2Fe-2S iron-sulfur cluster-binding protein n=1 Tax=Streptomyces sp. NPDC006460 TaxID=3154304 RepID=UPI0033A7BAB5